MVHRLTRLFVVIILQYILISKHSVVYPKLVYVNYTSINTVLQSNYHCNTHNVEYTFRNYLTYKKAKWDPQQKEKVNRNISGNERNYGIIRQGFMAANIMVLKI